MAPAQPDFNLAELEINRRIDDAINDARMIWSPRLPLNDALKDAIELKFQSMLTTLDSISSLDLNISPETIKRKVLYFNDAAQIPKNYIEKIRYLNSNRPNGEELCLVNLALGVAAINDIAMSYKNAERIRRGELTLEELHENAEKTAKDWDRVLERQGNITDKTRFGIAKGIFSVLEMVHPLEDEVGPNVYEQVIVGHYQGWRACYRHQLQALRYVRNVRDDFQENRARYRGVPFWQSRVCLPRIMGILANPKTLDKHVNIITLEEDDKPSFYT